MWFSEAALYSVAILALRVSTLAITRETEQEPLMMSIPTATSVIHSDAIETHTLIPATSIPFSRAEEAPPIVTPPPPANLQKRQPCCFDDRGFRVDCATWTGYYYTWGPQGNPYEGGPQCDGNWNGGSDGSGSGSGSGGSGNGQNGGDGVAPFDGAAAASRSQVPLVLGAAFLLAAVML